MGKIYEHDTPRNAIWKSDNVKLELTNDSHLSYFLFSFFSFFSLLQHPSFLCYPIDPMNTFVVDFCTGGIPQNASRKLISNIISWQILFNEAQWKFYLFFLVNPISLTLYLGQKKVQTQTYITFWIPIYLNENLSHKPKAFILFFIISTNYYKYVLCAIS